MIDPVRASYSSAYLKGTDQRRRRNAHSMSVSIDPHFWITEKEERNMCIGDNGVAELAEQVDKVEKVEHVNQVDVPAQRHFKSQ